MEIKKIIRQVLLEYDEVTTDKMTFWHGGNLNNYNDIIAQKNGRYEYGPGLYLTTHYDTAKKYSKGSRKLYKVTVENGVDINDALLSIENINDFINMYVIRSKKNEVLNRLSKHTKNDKIKAFIFNNILLNINALKPTNVMHLRQFYIDNNIDYEIVHNPFGWGEKMMVLYNMKKIVNVQQIGPKDNISDI